MKTKAKRLLYGSVNVELLQEVKKKILSEPRAFDMGPWLYRITKATDIPEEDQPPCKTVACIAGWAVALDHLKTHKTTKTCNHMDIPFLAEELLGIDGDTAGKIFYVTNWPKKFYNKFHLKDGKKDDKRHKAKVAAEYLDWVCGK